MDALIVYLTGKHMAILGPRGSGKTTLHHVLQHGVLPSESKQTVLPEKTAWSRSRETGLKIHRGRDLPGGERAYPDWRAQFERAQLVFYLFDSGKMRMDPKYAARLTQDSRVLKGWGVDGKSIYILGTHADSDPEYERRGAGEYCELALDHDSALAVTSRLRARNAYVAALQTAEDVVTAVRKLVGA